MPGIDPSRADREASPASSLDVKTAAAPSRLRQLFDQVSAMPADERDSFLSEQCADAAIRDQLRSMLSVPVDPLAQLGINSAATIANALAQVEVLGAPMIGARIGSFELLAVLGEGGSAIVYRASRSLQGVTQNVALKLLLRGLYTVQGRHQFDRERRALAQLQHPNIARLIEGGVTEHGQAFIALDLVEGESITEYARRHRLDVSARLGLFAQVCRAVDAAHHALIVHRDLKPSNVLVTADGQVKLLDFGIAKLLDADSDDRTQTHFLSLTPAYAAPEQLAGGLITTATDVYALGLLLGEILTGQRLNDAQGLVPSAQIITDANAAGLPLAPARWRKLLRGDLDNLILKAIAADPGKRYAAAGLLADDVDRFLEGRPLQAHPPSRWYRLGKFVSRHRVAVLSSGSLLLGLLLSLAVLMWQSSLARREANRANALRDFLVSAFAQAEPSTPRDGPPRITEVVADAVQRARGDQRMDIGVRIDLLNELGAVQRAQGQLTQARATLESNYTDAVEHLGADDARTETAVRELAYTLILTGDYVRARALIDQRLPSLAAGNAATYAKLLLYSATLATKQHQLARAVADGERGLVITRVLGDSNALADALSQLGNVQLSVGNAAAASGTYGELLRIRERELGPQHVLVAGAHVDLSRAYRRAGRIVDAEREIRAALAIDALVLPDNHWRRALHLNALTMVLLQQRDFPGALAAAEAALRIDRIAHGNNHPEIANDLNSIGMLHLRMEHIPEAVNWLGEALAATSSAYGAEHYETAVERSNYAVALVLSGKKQEGEAELMRAIASLQKLPEPDIEALANFYEKFARLKIEQKAGALALQWIDRIDQLPANPDPSWQSELGTLRTAALVSAERWSEAQAQGVATEAMLHRENSPDAAVRVELALLRAIISSQLDEVTTTQELARLALAELAALSNPPSRFLALAQRLRVF